MNPEEQIIEVKLKVRDAALLIAAIKNALRFLPRNNLGRQALNMFADQLTSVVNQMREKSTDEA